MTKIRQEEAKASQKNVGTAFIIFKDTKTTQKILNKDWLKSKINN